MKHNVTKAMVLAAGEGTRLRPFTVEVPKTLLTVGDVSLIEHILAWLCRHAVTEVVINLYHHGDKIREALGDGSGLGMEIRYSPEEILLGTAGGVKRAGEFFDDTFVVVYGDVLTNLDLSGMIRFHWEKKAMATLAVMKVANTSGVGIVDLDEDSRVFSFVEKPAGKPAPDQLMSGGIYVLEKGIIDSIPGDGFADFAYDVFPGLIKSGIPVYGYELGSTDYLIDIGTIEKYHRANQDVKAGKLLRS